MFKVMLWVGVPFTVIFFTLSIVIFVKKNLAEVIVDVMGWNVRKSMRKDWKAEKMDVSTVVLSNNKLNVDGFFEIVEEIVVIHTDERME